MSSASISNPPGMIREQVFLLPEILYLQHSLKQVVSRSADSLIHNLCVKAELPLTTQDYNRLPLKYIRLYVYIYNLTQSLFERASKNQRNLTSTGRSANFPTQTWKWNGISSLQPSTPLYRCSRSVLAWVK